MILGVGLIVSVRNRVSLMLARKLFHFQGSLIFLIGILSNVELLNVCFLLMFNLLVIVEAIRFSITALDSFFKQFTDKKDTYFILSHMTLLLGLGLPPLIGKLFLKTLSEFFAYIGILTIGIGDSAAGLIGRRIGKMTIPYSHKTVEGIIANFVFTVAFAYLFGVLEISHILIFSITSVYEGLTRLSDNLLVPILTMGLYTCMTTY